MTAAAIAARLAEVPGVAAVGWGGSHASGLADAHSDIDLYAFSVAPLATDDVRQRALSHDGWQVGSHRDFGLEDHLRRGDRLIEVVYLELPTLIEDYRVASTEGLFGEAFTTAFLHTVAVCRPLRDDSGRLAGLKAMLKVYPEATRTRLLAALPPIVDTWLTQLDRAITRADLPLVCHRRASLMAAWFNLLFAINRRYHPGEKRLFVHAMALPLRPRDAERRWRGALNAPLDDPNQPAVIGDLFAELLALG